MENSGIDLSAFAPAWRQFYQQLVSEIRVLVIDDDPSTGEVLTQTFKQAGFMVTLTDSAEEGWKKLTQERFDLAILDYNLPRENGIQLIQRIRNEGLSLPCVLATGETKAELVSKALEVGADDYLPKPFRNLPHGLTRMRALVDRRITKALFEVIIRDLSEAVRSGGMAEDGLATLKRDLFGFKIELEKRPQVLLFDNDEFEGQALANVLIQNGLKTALAQSHEQLFGMVRGEAGPLVVVLSLEVPNAILTIKRLKREDPQIEVLATAEGAEIEQAVRAVEAGAADFVLRSKEGLKPLGTRVKRLVTRCREHRLYLYLVTSLYRTAKKYNPDLADDLIFARDHDDVSFIRSTRPSETPPAPENFNLQKEYAENPKRRTGESLASFLRGKPD